MEKKLPIPRAILAFLAVLVFSQPVLSAKRSSTEQYLQELHTAGKERVIVRFNNQPDKSTIARYNAKLIRELKIINAFVCEIDQTAIESLKHQPNVKDVLPDAVIRIPEPTEVEASPQIIAPLLYQGPVTVRWNNLEAGLNSKAAWDRYNIDGTSVKIAVLDTGVNYMMENLGGGIGPGFKCLGGYDFVDHDSDPINPNSNEIHGTEVVSLAVGAGVNKVVGVAYNANYYAIRVAQGQNQPPATALTTDVIAGIEWASTEPHKADIISMSLGGYDEDHVGDPFWPDIKAEFEAACNAAYNAGVIIVAGSGNRAYDHSGYPAAFNNVVSVGGHDQNEVLSVSSNGGVDVIAPGARVYTVHPDNSAWWVWGTSFATPQASALIALQIQYARQNNTKVNNGYLWEVMKHSAHHLTGQAYDPVYQGSGKIYAAYTDGNDANIGSIDLMASNWPVDYGFQFHDYAFMDGNQPVYQIGSDVNQTITITNVTDILGNTVETIENLKVTATQVYYGEPNEPNLPGSSVEVFPTIATLEPDEANSITLSYVYTIPAETAPGVKKTILELEFNFAGNSRVIKIAYNEPNSFWYAAIPADLELDNNVDFLDYSMLAQHWGESNCSTSNWCDRADIDRNGDVGWTDLQISAENWLRGL